MEVPEISAIDGGKDPPAWTSAVAEVAVAAAAAVSCSLAAVENP